MPALRQLRNFLGLQSSLLGLLGMVILVGMGEKLAERFLPLYLIALGGGALSVGLLNGMDNLLSALYSFPGGYLAERFGAKKALLLFNFVAMAGYVVVIFIPRWEAVLLGAALFLSWSAISLPATMSLVAQTLPANKRAMGVSMHSLVRRIPMALGPLIGGLCVDTWGPTEGIRIAFVFALVMAVLATVLQQVMIEGPSSQSLTPEISPLRLMKRMPPALRGLLISDILIRFCEQIPYAFVVIWCMRRIESPVTGFQFGVLTAIEMATAVLVYIPVAYFADRGEKRPFVLMTFVFFTLFPLVLLFSRSFWPLVGAFVLRGLKEFGEPTRKSLILDLSPEDQQAGMFGLYYLVRDTIVSVAAFGGAFLWTIGPEVNFLAASAFGLLGTVWFWKQGRDVAIRAEPPA